MPTLIGTHISSGSLAGARSASEALGLKLSYIFVKLKLLNTPVSKESILQSPLLNSCKILMKKKMQELDGLDDLRFTILLRSY